MHCSMLAAFRIAMEEKVQFLPAGAQENEAENDDESQVKDQRVQRHLQLRVYL
jgi:hypothetical protein